jgi:hypothetical protein
MAPKKQNAVPDLVELIARLDISGSAEQCSALKVDLRVGSVEIDEECINFKVSANRLILDINVEGCEISPGTRFGEPVKANNIVIKKTSSTEASKNHNLRGNIEAKIGTRDFDPSIEIDGGGGAESKAMTRIEVSEEEVLLRVRAKPNSRWEVQEPDCKTELSGTYLNDTQLCQLKATMAANRVGFNAKIICNQRDLLFYISGGPISRALNKSRMMGIVVAKAISGDQQYKGRLVLSEVEGEMESQDEG